MKNSIRDLLIMVVIAVAVFVGIRTTVETYVVNGMSMEPNFWDQQKLLVNKVVYKLHEPERGDVIILNPPRSHTPRGYPFIKRIIGFPGESVEIKDGGVYIHQKDGTVLLLDEPYIEKPNVRPFKGDVIPENEYFVLGDNRNSSDDSSKGWTVPRENIIGKTWVSIWPPDKWGLAANYPLQGQVASASND